MTKIANIENLRVLKNITEEEYNDNMYEIEKLINSLLNELLDEKGMIDIDDRTVIRLVQDNNDLVASVTDMYRNYHKEQRIENWF